jgi:hypothetical protein
VTSGRRLGLRRTALPAWLGAGLLILSGTSVPAGAPDAAGAPPGEAQVAALVFPRVDVDGLHALGRGVLPVLARIYEGADAGRRAQVAYAFYVLGWKSPDAKRVLMRDVHTSDTNLRLQVQWALGRVSNDPDVLDVLLANMQDDGNPLFRDKAACALASDQIHLTEEQKVHLYGRLIQALRDPKLQVRSIALQALRIHTGQTKGFDPDAPPAQREQAIRTWESWLATYKDNL